MYFTKFPQTFYSLDNKATVQIVTNILQRVVFSEELKNNFSTFDEYDVQDGETPENLAFKLYGDAALHWLILHYNEIVDPRFEWPLSYFNLQRYTEGKYTNINGIHHFVNSSGQETTGNVSVTLDANVDVSVGSVLVNNSQNGKGFVTSRPNPITVIVTATDGSFQTGDEIYLASNSQIKANVSSSSVISGVPITNFDYEDTLNESRRRIKVLKPEFVELVIREFDSKIAEINV